MKKSTELTIAISYYALLSYIFVNWLLSVLGLAAFETVLLPTELGSILVRHLVSVLASIAIAALLTHKKNIRESFVPIFSLVLSVILGLIMIVCYATETTIHRWFLVVLLFASSVVLEFILETNSLIDAMTDFLFAYAIVGLFLELIDWAGIDLISFDGFLCSAFFGLVQVFLATHCHVLPKAERPALQVKPEKKTVPKDPPKT